MDDTKNSQMLSESLNYDQYIITAHDDDDDCSSGMDDDTHFSAPPKRRISEDIDFDDGSLKIDAEDSFVLMLGYLNTLDAYLKKNKNQGAENRKIISKLLMLKKLLIHNRKLFGVEQVRQINGILYVSNRSSNETESVANHETLQGAGHSRNQVDKSNYKSEGVKKKTKFDKASELVQAKIRTKVHAKKKQASKKTEMEMTTSASNLVTNTEKRGVKRKKPAPKFDTNLNNSRSKKKLKVYVSYTMQELKDKAKRRSTLTGEDLSTSLYHIKKEAGLDPPLPRKKSESKYINRDSEPLTSSPKVEKSNKNKSNASHKIGTKQGRKLQSSPSSSKSKSASTRGMSKNNNGRFSEPATSSKNCSKVPKNNLSVNDKSDILQQNNSTSTCKRALYSPDIWLEKLSKTDSFI